MSDSLIIVVGYDEKSREAVANSLSHFPVTVLTCAAFCEAETHLATKECGGIVVDLVSMVKAKGVEKLAAFSLTTIFPTLRVRVMGSMLVPMTMPGDARQDKTLDDFIGKTCAAFPPRRLRRHKRKEVCIPARITVPGAPEGSVPAFTHDLSWGGAFLVEMHAGRYTTGTTVAVEFPAAGLTVEAVVARVVPWGGHRRPGIGVQFHAAGEPLKEYLAEVLRSSEDSAPDRLTS